ncbi:hypothetical protein GCM10009815_02390 [Nocardioides marmoribigeumensis]
MLVVQLSVTEPPVARPDATTAPCSRTTTSEPFSAPMVTVTRPSAPCWGVPTCGVPGALRSGFFFGFGFGVGVGVAVGPLVGVGDEAGPGGPGVPGADHAGTAPLSGSSTATAAVAATRVALRDQLHLRTAPPAPDV